MDEKRTERVIIGTRESRLALVQAEQVAQAILQASPQRQVEFLKLKTTGDKILDRRLDQVGGKGLFVKELDLALQEGRSDLSVHSCKDLPMEIPRELPLLCFFAREDPRDVLVLPEGVSKLDLSKPIGTSSRRRALQLGALFPEARIMSVRGNLQTRLDKLERGEYGALVLAAAGLKRLGLEHRISRYFSVEEMIPAAGQGVLAIQGRSGEEYGYLASLGSREATLAVWSERAFVRALDGGCSSPIAAYGQLTGEGLKLTGLYCREGSDRYVTGSRFGQVRDQEDCETLGRALARELQEQYREGV